jgi:hypothetical protein
MEELVEEIRNSGTETVHRGCPNLRESVPGGMPCARLLGSRPSINSELGRYPVLCDERPGTPTSWARCHPLPGNPCAEQRYRAGVQNVEFPRHQYVAIGRMPSKSLNRNEPASDSEGGPTFTSGENVTSHHQCWHWADPSIPSQTEAQSPADHASIERWHANRPVLRGGCSISSGALSGLQ